MEAVARKLRPSEAIFIIDQNRIMINCNNVVEDIVGWPSDVLIGQVFTDILLPEGSASQFTDMLHLFTEGVGCKGIIMQKIRHRDGYELPVELNVLPIVEKSARSYIITARDMRERTLQVRELEQASQNQKIVNSILKIALEDYSLEEILFHALDSVLTLNTPKLLDKGAVLLVNGESDYLVLKAQKGFGEQQVKACARIPFGTCHCGRAALTGEVQFSECIDEKHDIRLENMMPHGHYCVPICSGDNVLGVMSLYLQEGHLQNEDEMEVLRAVTNILAGVIERKKVEIERHQLIDRQKAMITRIFDEKKLNESIIQSLNAGLMVFDLEGNIVTLNPSGRSILDQFLETDLASANRDHLYARIPIVLRMRDHRNGMTEKTDEESGVNANGEEKTLHYTIVPWENSSGLQMGVILLFRDITEKLRFQREMENMNRLSTVAEIASAVAHEVRNPLAGIKTMSQAIEENCQEGDENREYITRIIKQVDRLNDLLTEFFTYARPGEAKKEKVSMAAIINEIRQLLKVKLASNRIVMEEDYDQGLPDIYVDPDQMHQVFLNLMLNAMDAMGNNGKIYIGARLADQQTMKMFSDLFPDLKDNIDYVSVSFKDTGKGMPPEVAEKAFEPFFTTKANGSGLGLAIVHRILTENNAFIMADASKEKGMAFQMMFESVH